MEIKQADVVLCAFYFSDTNQSKNRPVLVFKDNLPYDDFIAVPISSKIHHLYQDEMMMSDIDFIDGTIPVASKLMMRKTFVVSKKAILKKYGTISAESYKKYHRSFCQYFNCAGSI
ncbi:type II toxin-antitoxin system PemK/MazF family toxin [Sulfuricurvum sp.]|uniref:type II toxin-antitoxin system PemK/MazF family toxin n=1 Tax=Sulfuricurvum sp. TaxID=2025608 RepID=UPI003C32B807